MVLVVLCAQACIISFDNNKYTLIVDLLDGTASHLFPCFDDLFSLFFSCQSISRNQIVYLFDKFELYQIIGTKGKAKAPRNWVIPFEKHVRGVYLWIFINKLSLVVTTVDLVGGKLESFVVLSQIIFSYSFSLSHIHTLCLSLSVFHIHFTSLPFISRLENYVETTNELVCF